MRRILIFLLLCLTFIVSGFALSQDQAVIDAPDVDFTIVGEIGRALPRKIVYDSNNEQMAVVDAYNRLLLINALDYKTKAVLYEKGEYIDVLFSHNGRWLAVLNGLNVELWDTETGTLAASLTNLGNILQLTGPIAFSSNDDLLLFYGVSPAPLAIRQSENDVVTYPWMWHLTAALDQGESTFPNEAEFIRMSDYANGFVLSPDDRIVAALPARLAVLDAYTLDTLYEIPTERYERDPLTVWNSLEDNSVYVRPVNSNSLIQVDTEKGVLVEFPTNVDLTRSDIALIGDVELGEAVRTIGGQNISQHTRLSEIFLGIDYSLTERKCDDFPRTVTLIDLVVPPARQQDNVLALLYSYNEREQLGCFILAAGGQQMVLSPDGNELLIRRTEGDEYVITYDLASGREIRRFLPALRGIGSYNRIAKNRVLAYNGDIIISDFQRLESDTNEILAEDLRYSRSFERFYFSEDSQKIITMSGSEWREWSIETGEVLRREVLYLSGTIIATSSDGSRFLTQSYDSRNSSDPNDDITIMSVRDLATGNDYSVEIKNLPHVSVSRVVANPSWTKFLAIYSENSYGPYYPGNEIALYDYQDGLKWVIAGDDLPPSYGRNYGWIDENTVFVSGQGRGLPARVFGVDYDLSGLPSCLVAEYPEQVDNFLLLWDRLLYYMRGDDLAQLALNICNPVPTTSQQVAELLKVTPTPSSYGSVGDAAGEVPQCLIQRYPGDEAAYREIWLGLINTVSLEEARTLAQMLCEGIGIIPPTQEIDPSLNITMLIDSESGERASGSYQPPSNNFNPLQPIMLSFQKAMERPLGTALLSPNKDLIAASNLPGELIVYSMSVTYEDLVEVVTATAASKLATANLIFPQASPSPTYNIIGTPRPTLTPTLTQTWLPNPQEGNDVDLTNAELCPAETLYSASSPPAEYDAEGQIYAVFSDGPLWSVQPENGVRREAPEIPQCRRGIDCQFSPDKSWILARSYDLIYVVRPDNSDERVLWDLRTPYYMHETPVPQNIYWSGNDTLEWQHNSEYLRDVLNVFPDPAPWKAEAKINEIPAQFISRQPGGPWTVFSTSFNTGSNTAYKYYLYNVETQDTLWFAQGSYNVWWHPLGERLFYSKRDREIFQVVFPESERQVAPRISTGVWSNNGRYRIFSTENRAQPISVYDTETGSHRSYCLPETGARLYSGPFVWSPDSRYVALQAPLPRDESQQGVGQHLLVLNIETGQVVDVTTGIYELVAWAQEPGTYGSGDVITPTPFFTVTPTP